ncbi:MAG: hypothetical protein KC493_15020 [Bacteriovoracaceae bacterium]|nr:hypothetical protein [Bacteriovoracaceae bacterium]
MKLIVSIILLSLISTTQAAEWKKIKRRKNVDVYSKDIPGSKVVAFRGIGVIDAPIENVVSVIHDTSRIKEWMSDMAETVVLERKTKFDKVEYNRTTAPWPLWDREFVYWVKVDVKGAGKEIHIEMGPGPATHPKIPKRDKTIRGSLHSSRYILKSLEGRKTEILVEINADPKGSVPKWVVNLFQSVWPSETISGIRKLATEPNYNVHADIKSFMKENKIN